MSESSDDDFRHHACGGMSSDGDCSHGGCGGLSSDDDSQHSECGGVSSDDDSRHRRCGGLWSDGDCSHRGCGGLSSDGDCQHGGCGGLSSDDDCAHGGCGGVLGICRAPFWEDGGMGSSSAVLTGSADTAGSGAGGWVSVELLEAEIRRRSANLTAAEADWLLLIAEFDRRGGWEGSGCTSCAVWLSWQCGVDRAVAYEKVRVGRVLEQFPGLAAGDAVGGVVVFEGSGSVTDRHG